MAADPPQDPWGRPPADRPSSGAAPPPGGVPPPPPPGPGTGWGPPSGPPATPPPPAGPPSAGSGQHVPGWGAPGAPTPPRRSRTPWLVLAGVVAVVGVATGLLLTLGGPEVDQAEVVWSAEVAQDLHFDGARRVDDVLIARTRADILYAFALDTGEQRWVSDALTDGDLFGLEVADHGIYAVHDDGSGAGPTLRAFGAAAGTQRWTYRPEDREFATPFLDRIVVLDDAVAVLAARELAVLEPDGQVRWTAMFDGEDHFLGRHVVAAGDVLVAELPSIEDTDHYELRGYDLATGEQRWRTELDRGRVRAIAGTDEGAAVVVDPQDGGDSIVRGLDPTDGSTRWDHELDHNFQGGIWAADGDRVALSLDRGLLALDLVDGSEVFTLDEEERGYALGTVADGELAVVGGRTVERYDLGAGELTVTLRLPADLFAGYGGVTLVGDTVIVQTDARVLTALE